MYWWDCTCHRVYAASSSYRPTKGRLSKDKDSDCATVCRVQLRVLSFTQSFGVNPLHKFQDCEIRHQETINQSINQFISHHSTETRATVRLCRIKEKCLKTDLKCVNGWSSSVDSSVEESSRVSEQQQRNDEQQCPSCAAELTEASVWMIAASETDCMGWSNQRGNLAVGKK